MADTKKTSKTAKRVKQEIVLGMQEISTENPRNVYGLYSSEFANPTPDDFRYYLESMRRGLNFWAALLFTHMRRRDLHMKSVCQTRKLPLIAKEWLIESVKESKKDKKNSPASEAIRKMFKPKWFIQFLADCVEAQISGLSAFELNWMIKDSLVWLERAKLIPNHLTVYDDRNDKYFFVDITDPINDVFKMRTLGYTTTGEDRIDLKQLKLIDLPEIKKLEVHSFDGDGGNGLLNGFIDGLMWAYMKRNLAGKDWAIYLEKHADPPVTASYDDFTSETSQSKAFNATKQFGRSKYAIHPKSVEFKVHDSAQKAGTSQLFKDYITEHKEEISIAILGQTLTTSVGQRGTQALGTVHDKVRSDLQYADMILVSLAVNELIEKICSVNFPGLAEDEIPVFKFKATVDTEFKKAVAVMIRDLRVAGFKAKAEEVSRIYDMTFEETNAVGAAPEDDLDNSNTRNADDPDPDDGEEDKTEPDQNEDKQSDKEAAKLIRQFEKMLNFASKKDTNNKVKKYLEKIFEGSNS